MNGDGDGVPQGVKRSFSGDEVDENDEKKIKIPQNLSGENEETEHDRTTAILDLNDDCFYLILSYLETYDLTKMANTCVRLRNCATYVVEHYHKSCIRFDYPTNGFLNTNEVRDAVRIFGPHTKQLTINMKIFNKLFSSDSALSMVDHYCKTLDTITLNELQFTKWFPAKYVDPFVDSDDDDDGWKNDYDSDEDRDWIVGYVSPKFLTNLPQVKNLIINKGILFCGCRLFENWKDQVDSIAMKDVLVGDGFLKALRNSYDEVKMTIHSETRRGRGNILHNNFRIVEALFTPKVKGDNTLKTE